MSLSHGRPAGLFREEGWDGNPARGSGVRALTVFLLVALVAVVLVAVTSGPAEIGPATAARAILAGFGLGGAEAVSELHRAIVFELRLPRVVTAACVGAGLALCGAVMQGITRNPLADPYLLGLSSGAAVGAVAAILAGMALLLPLGAFLGALAALGLTLGLAGALGAITPTRVILAGIAVSAFASAVTSLLIFWSSAGDSYREILSWLMGSLAGAGWREAGIAAAALALVGGPVLLVGRALDAFTFGDRAAATLGVPVARTRWVLLLASALLTGFLVSVSGAIGFVGLVVPNALRLVVGARHRDLLPLSALAGAVVLIAADTAARSMFVPRELPVGIVTAMIGAPAFLAILLRHRGAT